MRFKLLLVVITLAASPLMGQGQFVGSSIDACADPVAKNENGTVEINRGEKKDLNSRMERMEAKSQRQDKEINVLKTLLEEEKQFSKELSGRISQLEASTIPSFLENYKLLARPKRPYRLLPPHITIEKNNKDVEMNHKFFGPAANCDELGLIGYTLNGYYLVKKTTDSTKKGSIEIVYCQFQQLDDQKQSTTSHMQTVLDLDNSELEVQIMDRVSHKLLPIDYKIMEQTKQIKEIFGLLGKRDDDNGLPIESKKDDIINYPGNLAQSVGLVPTTPSPPFITSTAVSKTLKITKTETEKFTDISSSPDDRNFTFSREQNDKECENVRVTEEAFECRYTKRRRLHVRLQTHSSIRVTCERVPICSIKQFFKMKNFNNNLLEFIQITLFSEDEWIPADILGNKTTEELVIAYNDHPNPVALLKVDVNAFQSTKNYTKTLKLYNFNGSKLDLGFLLGFNQLTKLTFYNVHHIQKSLPTLPLLPKLTSLEFENVRGFNDAIITFPHLSSSGLERLQLFSGEHSDASISRILDWVLLSSAKTLKFLEVHKVKITKVPSQIPSFTALDHLDLGGNSITDIKNGALSFSVPVSKLTLSNNNIGEIEPGAFQGNFSDADINMDSNSLIRFEESVFRPTLEQIASGKGRIKFNSGNRIDCSIDNICHLAWAIRDSKLKAKTLGKCSNGIDFSELGKSYVTTPTKRTRRRTTPSQKNTTLGNLQLIRNNGFDHC